MTKKSNVEAVTDLVKAIKEVFIKQSKIKRDYAWEVLTSKKGQKEMENLINAPNSHPISKFRTIVPQSFKEWINSDKS